MNKKRLPEQANPLSVVNHELKSQLFGIKAYAQLLEKRLEKQPDVKLLSYIQKINAQVDALSFSMSDFIDYVKIQEKSFTLSQEFLRIDDVMQQAVKIVKQLFPQTEITIKGETHRDVFVDRNKLEKVIYALLANAAIYSIDTPKIEIYINQLAKNTTISVKDNGIGMGKKELTNIFRPFYTISLKEFKKRSGLGLFVAKEIVDLHKGRLLVNSKKEKGSEFIISLPF